MPEHRRTAFPAQVPHTPPSTRSVTHSDAETWDLAHREPTAAGGGRRTETDASLIVCDGQGIGECLGGLDRPDMTTRRLTAVLRAGAALRFEG